MILRFYVTRSKEDFLRFARTKLVDVGEITIFCDYYDNDHKTTEPSIWVPVNDRYDVWQLVGEEVIGGSITETQLKALCTCLIEKLYNNGFSNGNFQS
jgi:hypothetical protein